jgi:hypothetical protein
LAIFLGRGGIEGFDPAGLSIDRSAALQLQLDDETSPGSGDEEMVSWLDGVIGGSIGQLRMPLVLTTTNHRLALTISLLNAPLEIDIHRALTRLLLLVDVLERPAVLCID